MARHVTREEWNRLPAIGLVASLLGLGAAGCIGIVPLNLSTVFLRPNAQHYGSPEAYGYPYDARRLTVAAEREVAIWHVHAPDPRAIVVIAPASDRNKSLYVRAIPIFVPAGYDVILMDYEGFGESSGTIFDLDLAELPEDALAVVDYALTQHDRVVVFGISTGGSSAVWAAANRELAAVILEAPLVLEHEVQYWLVNQGFNDPLLWGIANIWVHPQIPSTFDILDTVRQVDEPKLIMHSRGDDTVPFQTSELLYEAAPEPKTFVELEGGHIKMIDLDPARYAATIIDWLDQQIDGPVIN